MTLHVIAHTTHDGPVVLRSCETVQEQQDSLGGDEVLGFVYELSGGAEATQSPAADTRTYGQLALI